MLVVYAGGVMAHHYSLSNLLDMLMGKVFNFWHVIGEKLNQIDDFLE